MKRIRAYVFVFIPIPESWVAHASRALAMGVLAIANFCRFFRFSGFKQHERRFRRDAETSTRDACATERSALDVVRL